LAGPETYNAKSCTAAQDHAPPVNRVCAYASTMTHMPPQERVMRLANAPANLDQFEPPTQWLIPVVQPGLYRLS